MHRRVGIAVVGLLEQLIGADLGLLEMRELLDRQRREIDVEPPDVAVRLGHVIHGPDRVEHVVEATARHRIPLAGNHQQALVALFYQFAHVGADTVHGERRARQLLVGRAERAVGAVVAADVGNVQRREQHHAPAVDFFLDLPRSGEQFLRQIPSGDAAQRRHLGCIQSLQLACLGQDLAHAPDVGRGSTQNVLRVGGMQPLGGRTEVPIHAPFPVAALNFRSFPAPFLCAQLLPLLADIRIDAARSRAVVRVQHVVRLLGMRRA